MSYRLVIDTNLTISALIWGGLPLRLYDQAVVRRIPILISQAMMDELETTLRKPKFARYLQERRLTVEGMMSRLAALTESVTPAAIPDRIVRDPKDQIILATAVGGSATHLISGDKDLTSLGQYHQITILTAAELLTLLNPLVG
jgi:putative PIN family toxin of toxin-antitoxin system